MVVPVLVATQVVVMALLVVLPTYDGAHTAGPQAHTVIHKCTLWLTPTHYRH